MARAKTGQNPRVTAARVKLSGPPIANETGATPRAEPKAVTRAAMHRVQGPPLERMAYTIPQFCLAHNISLDSYYRMQRAGTGPKIKKVGHSTRITIEAAKAWREAGEAATKKVETKGEANREAKKAASAEA